MSTTEPVATAILLALFGALLAVSALFSRASQRFAIPVALVFLGVGMIALGALLTRRPDVERHTDVANT